MTPNREKLRHTIPPHYTGNSRILILGTFPSPKSREANFFYGHPQNLFWRVISEVFGHPTPQTIAEKKQFLTAKRIALWDVLQSCSIKGASDSSIKNIVVNDFGEILATSEIKNIFCTGKTAHRLYEKYCAEKTGIKAIYLPSTSPANKAHYPYPVLLKEWQILLDFL
ncbi:MAG: DNA-deoxyinosine glycosylase [Bacillota bacterium]|jgi:TDG/mug DNA glycosylase family protein